MIFLKKDSLNNYNSLNDYNNKVKCNKMSLKHVFLMYFIPWWTGQMSCTLENTYKNASSEHIEEREMRWNYYTSVAEYILMIFFFKAFHLLRIFLKKQASKNPMC